MAKRKVDKRLAKNFGETLRRARETYSVTQEELAANADFHRTYIGFLEQGRRQPSLKVVFDLAYGLNMLPSDLVRHVERIYFATRDGKKFLEAAEKQTEYTRNPKRRR